MKDVTFQSEFPSGFMAVLDERDRLEFEVSQLLDGTLDPSRIHAVEAAVAGDAQLAALLADMSGVNTLLTRTPSPTSLGTGGDAIVSNVMNVVLTDAGVAAGTAALGSASVSFWSQWSVTIASVAAALVVGVTVGVVAMNSGTSDPGVLAGDGVVIDESSLTPAPVAKEQPSLVVAGPSMASAGQGNADLRVVGLTGPETVADSSENVGGLSPDYAALYNAGVVVERPSRVIVAGSD